MKKVLLFSFALALLMIVGCKSEEQIRVEKVVGVYDCYADCDITDLSTVGQATNELDTAILYVTRPYDDENGFIVIMGQEVFLNQDLTFKKSTSNYTLEGEFDGGKGLVFTTDIVDTDANTRSQCSYICTLKD
jgi:hypothetical protein